MHLIERLHEESQKSDRVYMFTVGGSGEFGMNMTCYIHRGSLILVDCGLAFAPDYEIGIDAHIPEIDDLIERFGGITAYLITHGHEDHLGALPHFLRQWPAPVYATEWTIALLKDKLRRHRIPSSDLEINCVRAGDSVKTGFFKSHWIGMPHSIPMTCSLVIEAGSYRFLHTGDFKLNHHTDYEKPANLERIKHFGSLGIDAVIGDSTNAHVSGKCPSECEVKDTLTRLIKESPALCVITTFASNLWRLKTIADICEKLGKNLHFVGSGLLKTIDHGSDMGLFSYAALPGLNSAELKNIDRANTVIVMTGSQAEHKSALSRVIAGDHASIKLEKGDRIIFSSRMIPGNERGIYQMISQCHKMGIEIITPKHEPLAHVSGHAYKEDLEELYRLAKPRFIIPVHGTFTQLEAHASLEGQKPTAPKAIRVENGALIEFNGQEAITHELYGLSMRYVDSWSRLTMDYDTMRSRLKIGDSGLCIVHGLAHRERSKWHTEIEISLIGIPDHPSGDWDLWKDATSTWIAETIQADFITGDSAEDINEAIRRKVRKDLAYQLVKKPVVLSHVAIIETNKG